MNKRLINNTKLGVFVIAGLLILVVSLYFIGQNQNVFGSGFAVKVRFANVNGLMPGNNVRFSGIQCGTVKSIDIVNDTTIEVRLLINSKTAAYIRANSTASIGTEGLMGNKVVNILPGTPGVPMLQDGGMLAPAGQGGIEDIMSSLSVTGENARTISENLKRTTDRIDNSPLLQQLLSDTLLATDLHRSLANFRSASEDVEDAASSIRLMLADVRKGKGAAGVLLTDQQTAAEMKDAIAHITSASRRADQLVAGLDSLVGEIHSDAANGRGAVHMLLKDTVTVQRVSRSLEHIEHGTAAFKEDMEALKHNFLLRGYFRKQAKKQKK